MFSLCAGQNNLLNIFPEKSIKKHLPSSLAKKLPGFFSTARGVAQDEQEGKSAFGFSHLDLPLDFVGFTWKTETSTLNLLFQVTCPEDLCMVYLPTFTIQINQM